MGSGRSQVRPRRAHRGRVKGEPEPLRPLPSPPCTLPRLHGDVSPSPPTPHHCTLPRRYSHPHSSPRPTQPRIRVLVSNLVSADPSSPCCPPRSLCQSSVALRFPNGWPGSGQSPHLSRAPLLPEFLRGHSLPQTRLPSPQPPAALPGPASGASQP